MAINLHLDTTIIIKNIDKEGLVALRKIENKETKIIIKILHT